MDCSYLSFYALTIALQLASRSAIYTHSRATVDRGQMEEVHSLFFNYFEYCLSHHVVAEDAHLFYPMYVRQPTGKSSMAEQPPGCTDFQFYIHLWILVKNS